MDEEIVKGAALFTLGLCVGFGINLIITKDKQNQQKDNHLLGTPIPQQFVLPKKESAVCMGGISGDADHIVGKRLTTDGHLGVFGPSGSGKTSCVVTPSLKTGRDYRIFIDVKGNLVNQWMQLNGNSGKRLVVFNPYDASRSNCYYDPFAIIRQDEAYLADNLLELAKTMIPFTPNSINNIWEKSAESILAGALIYKYRAGETFVATMHWINDTPLQEIVNEIGGSNDVIAKPYIRVVEAHPRVVGTHAMEFGCYLPQFTTSSAFYNAFTPLESEIPFDWKGLFRSKQFDFSGLEPSKSTTLLDWQDLNSKEPFDVILEFPENKLDVAQPLLCMVINQMIRSLERRKLRCYNSSELPPILITLDEFPRLGRIPALHSGINTLRARGVTFLLIAQSLASIEKIYGVPESREILDNLQYKIIFGATDVKSQKYFSELVGTKLINRFVPSVNASLSGSFLNGDAHFSLSAGVSAPHERVSLVEPYMFGLLKNQAIVCSPDGAFMVEKRPIFFNGCANFNRDPVQTFTPPSLVNSANILALPPPPKSNPQSSTGNAELSEPLEEKQIQGVEIMSKENVSSDASSAIFIEIKESSKGRGKRSRTKATGKATGKKSSKEKSCPTVFS